MVDVGGVVSIVVFYALILIIGVIAARKTGFKTKNLSVSEVMLADRSIGIFVGCFTMTATWVGGGYINGSTEITFTDGLVWCQAPLGYSIGLLFSGFFFAEKMRTSGFTTMLDPFHWKYGDLMNCLLYIPALTGDVFWSASILSALGATLKVILEIDLNTSILLSAGISLLYTLLGGLYSVAYTDVVQLICMFIGLWLCVPFALTNDAAASITSMNATDLAYGWIGELTPLYIGNYMDYALLLIFGGIPWQVYWQRALSAKTVRVAKILSFIASFGCIIMALPAVLLGAVAKMADWSKTDYGHPTLLPGDKSLTLPLVMKHLCPPVVMFIGLGAVSAAVMSSTDSSILSSSSMFSRNIFSVIYTRIKKRQPSETAQVWVMRGAQVVIAGLACVMAIKVDSIYSLFVLCGDFVYVILFPQLVCVMYLIGTNSYGSLSAFIVGLFFRLTGGESALSIPALIEYPWFQEETATSDGTQLFPFRTMSMLISLLTHVCVSYLTDYLFTNEMLPITWDVYGCFDHLRYPDKSRLAHRMSQVGESVKKDNNGMEVRHRSTAVEEQPDRPTSLSTTGSSSKLDTRL